VSGNDIPEGSTLDVRYATDADTEFLMDLARAAYFDVVARQFGGWNEDVHGKRYLEKIGEGTFSVILLNGARVGTVHALEEDGRFVLGELVVHPDYQGRGIGAWALKRVLRQAQARGKPLWLHTMRENHGARAFYRRHGFVETTVSDTYIEMEAQ
jgi:ribosomal protein S18 acetylase RimI-like enzyme